MLDYESKIYKRRCFLVFTENMLELMKNKTKKENLELHITKDTLEICLYDDNGELMYDEEDMIECISDKMGIEINNMFLDGDELGGVLYFIERRLE